MTEMNDRELLELAAIAYTGGHFFGFDSNGDALIDPVVYCPFNPLENDSDALRLAVKLGIQFHIEGDGHDEMVWANEFWLYTVGDAMKSTRRAIVRAAAEIGRQM